MEQDPLDKLKMLGQISMRNDPSFDANNHLAQQLNSGPFKDSADRHQVWQPPSADEEALQQPVIDPLMLMSPSRTGGSLGANVLQKLSQADKDQIALGAIKGAYHTWKQGVPALALPTYEGKKKKK